MFVKYKLMLSRGHDLTKDGAGGAVCSCVWGKKKSFHEAAGGGGEGFPEEMAFSPALKIIALPEEEGEMWKGAVANGNRTKRLSSLDLGWRCSLMERWDGTHLGSVFFQIRALGKWRE